MKNWCTSRITSKVGDHATEQFMKMISEVVPKYKDKFLEFNKYEHHNDCSVINQSKESLIALRIVKNNLNAKNVTAANIPIT